MASNAPGFNLQFAHDGQPAIGYLLYSFITGTTTPKDTFKDAAGGVAHTNPIELDDQGRPPDNNLFLDTDENYDFVLHDPDDAPIGVEFTDVQAVPEPADEVFLPLTGGTLSGPLELPGDATADLEATPLQQVQDLIAAAVAAAVADLQTQIPPIGTIYEWGLETPPTKHLILNGSAVSRTGFPDLFDLWGTTYGTGDGTTTFNLQDRRGLFARGLDQGLGEDPGRVLGEVQEEEVGPHTHSYVATSNANPGGAEGGNRDSAGHGISYTTGSGDGTENRPRNFTTIWIVRALA